MMLSKSKLLIVTVAAASVLSAAVAHAEKLRVIGDVGFAPYAMIGASGEAEGYNVDILAGVAKRLGYEGYEVVDVPFSSMFVALNSGQYAFAISATQVTKERAENALFAEPFVEADFGILTLKDAGANVKALADLKGKSIAVNSGSLPDTWFTQHQAEYGWTINRYGKTSDAAQAVFSGRDFALASGEGSIAWLAKKNPRAMFNFSVPTDGKYAFIFPNNSVEMRDKVELAIECMKQDGEIAKIHEKWIGKAPREGSIAYKPLPGYGAEGMKGYDATPHQLTCTKN